MENGSWNNLTDEQRAEKEKLLSDLERGAQSYIQLANETVHMLQYLTTSIIDPFLRPEIIDRLAAMLNYNLVLLVGPKCSELKVKNPEKFQFNPRTLLSDIIDIYLHLSPNASRNDFAVAVARDGRSYQKACFEKAASILLNRGVKPEKEVQHLLEFLGRCEDVVKQDQQAEEEMGDIPDEFLDPLMFTLMEDPVILPSSRTTVDRSTITSHLLSDATDPFNRMPLTIEQVIPDEDMKKRIAEWKQSLKKK
jgi:ubiquitin conjugation factor E4 B